MFDVKPMNLFEEIHSGEANRDRHLQASADLIRGFHGGAYRGTGSEDFQPTPENHAFEFIALVTSKIIFDNPIVDMRSRFSGANRDAILRLKHAVNQWSNTFDFWRTLMHTWYDVCFSFGVIRTTLQSMPGYEPIQIAEGKHVMPKMPISTRIAPDRFLIDHRCEDAREARYMGHTWRRDKEDLLSAPAADGFNKEIIEAIAEDSGLEKVESKASTSGRASDPTRKEIVGHEVWVPEITLPGYEDNPHFHGTLYTLAVAESTNQSGDHMRSKPKYLREPQPYYGPAQGPYEMFGLYWVPKSIFPLSPLVATDAQAKELNAHATAASRSAANYKRIIAYNPNNPAAGQTVQNADHGSVVAITNLTEDVQELTLGGVQPEQYQYLGQMRDRLDRNSGLNESARGNVTGDGTATETADAASQRDNRIGLMGKMFNDATRRVLNRVGWFHHNSEFVRTRLGDDAANELYPRDKNLPQKEDSEKLALEYSNPDMDPGDDPLHLASLSYTERVGAIRDALDHNPEARFPSEDMEGEPESLATTSKIRYEDLDLIIEPLSMARTDQGMMQKRVQDQFALVSGSAQIMAQTPWIKWQKMFENWGHSLNSPEFADVIDIQALKEAQGQSQEIMANEAQATEGQQPGGGQGGAPGVSTQGMGAPKDVMAAAAQQGQELAAAARKG